MPLYTDAELEKLLNDSYNNNTKGVPWNSSERPSPIELLEWLKSLFTGSAKEEFGDGLKKLLLRFGARYEAPNFHHYTEYNPNMSVQSTFVPKKLYFYYFKFDHNGALISRVFAADINTNKKEVGGENGKEFDAEIIDKITSWVSNNPENQCAPSKNDLIEINPDKVLWREPSYLAFMLDEDTCEFHQSGSNNALHFSKQVLPEFIEVMDHKNKIETNGETCSNKHKCFCNSRILNSKSLRPILLVENRHISFRTGEIRCENDDSYDIYKFDLLFRVQTSPPTYPNDLPRDQQKPENSKKLTMIIDPTGTNFGPP